MCRCTLVDYNKRTTFVQDVDSGEAVHALGKELSVLLVQFCCEPKTALKNKVLKKMISFFHRTALYLCEKSEWLLLVYFRVLCSVPGSPIFHSTCQRELGVALESLQGKESSSRLGSRT